MSLEAWSTAASIGTFVVIAATAAAALVQLRHMRSNNQIAAITSMYEMLDSERLLHARRFVAEEVPKIIADPARRNQLGSDIFPPELEELRQVGNSFDLLGAFVKLDIIDRNLACDLWDGVVFRTWKQLEPVCMIRRKVGYAGIWCDFEYLAVICEKSLSRSQGDYYPRGVPRMAIDKRSLDAAAAFTQDQGGASEHVAKV